MSFRYAVSYNQASLCAWGLECANAPVFWPGQVGDRAGGGGDVRRACAGARAAIAELLALTKDFKEEVSLVRFFVRRWWRVQKPSGFLCVFQIVSFAPSWNGRLIFVAGFGFCPVCVVPSKCFDSTRVLQAVLMFVFVCHASFFPTMCLLETRS